MWFKEILLITFQFCRLGECNWNDKVGERLHDFHVVLQVCFHEFLTNTILLQCSGEVSVSISDPPGKEAGGGQASP